MKYKYRDSDKQRLYSRSDIKGPDDCWNCNYFKGNSGYPNMGMLRVGKHKTMASAHVVSYEIHKGAIPEGLIIRHTCNNKICINPAHLITGTRYDNAADRFKDPNDIHYNKEGTRRFPPAMPKRNALMIKRDKERAAKRLP